jgi:hypothetical protein
MTPSLSSDGNTIDENITTDVISDSTTFTVSETATSPELTSIGLTPESTSSDLPPETAFNDIIFEPLADCTSFGIPLLDSNISQSLDFIINADQNIIKQCEKVHITWSGTDITPPYRISYSKGTGELEDTSILGDEIELICKYWEQYTWSIPPGRKGKSDILPSSQLFIRTYLFISGKIQLFNSPAWERYSAYDSG